MKIVHRSVRCLMDSVRCACNYGYPILVGLIAAMQLKLETSRTHRRAINYFTKTWWWTCRKTNLLNGIVCVDHPSAKRSQSHFRQNSLEKKVFSFRLTSRKGKQTCERQMNVVVQRCISVIASKQALNKKKYSKRDLDLPTKFSFLRFW